jgi:uncharacterized protein YigA (DUF484 family)
VSTTTRDLFADLGPEPRPKAAELNWPQVRGFLEAHPEHLAQDRELQESLGLKPSAPPNVVDFGRAALAKLEAVAARECGARKAIEQVARANFSAQAQTHAAVIELLESRNHADLARRLDAAATRRFGLVGGSIALEGTGGVPHGWRRLEEGDVDRLIGPEALSRLGRPAKGAAETLFGAEAAKVESLALVRLAPWAPPRHALVAFGSGEQDGFTPEMGAELVAFLARVVERMAERWPVL